MDKVSVSIATNNTVRAQINQDKMTARIPGVKVIERGGTADYNELTNKPSINEHVLTGGENTLTSLGIGRASIEDINRLFREG